MRIHNFEQHSDDWYAIRCGRFTASVADTIATAGQGLETLCFKVAAEKLTGHKEENFKSAAMEHGNELEAVARTLFEMKTGYTVEEVGFVEIDDLEGSSPDGLIHIGDEITGVEFKCPQDNTYAKLLFDRKIKPEYYAQIQMQMRHVGANRWFYCVYNPHFAEEMVIVEVAKDAVFQDKLDKGLTKGKARVREILAQISANFPEKADAFWEDFGGELKDYRV